MICWHRNKGDEAMMNPRSDGRRPCGNCVYPRIRIIRQYGLLGQQMNPVHLREYKPLKLNVILVFQLSDCYLPENGTLSPWAISSQSPPSYRQPFARSHQSQWSFGATLVTFFTSAQIRRNWCLSVPSKVLLQLLDHL